MIRLDTSIVLQYEAAEAATFILNIQPVENAHQHVEREALDISPWVDALEFRQAHTGNRLLRFDAPRGPITVSYECVVDIDHRLDDATTLYELPASDLPNEVLPYILPSRYCESDRLMSFARSQFGTLARGYQRVETICRWVRNEVEFQSGTSDWSTSAWDVFQRRRGVCRDFAHLSIALCRALNIPTRFVSGVDYGADPSLGPTDFHAYIECFLGRRWYLFDPTQISPVTGLIRIGTGRDAADAPFATIFGNVRTHAPAIAIHAIDDPSHGFELPERLPLAVSTAALVRAD